MKSVVTFIFTTCVLFSSAALTADELTPIAKDDSTGCIIYLLQPAKIYPQQLPTTHTISKDGNTLTFTLITECPKKQ